MEKRGSPRKLNSSPEGSRAMSQRNRPAWYLSKVKSKQNRSWTDEEKIRVYTLRTDFKAREIAKLFNTNTTQIYNITRLVKKSFEGKCYHCNNPLEHDETLQNRIEQRAYEIFVSRGSVPGNPQDDWAQAEKEIKAKEPLIKLCNKCKNELVEYKRGLRDKAIEAGLCGYCHRRKVVEGKKACEKCLSATHRRREQKGLCGACGKHRIVHKGGALCKYCMREHRIKKSQQRQSLLKKES